MLKDVLGRALKAGDLVLYTRKNSSKVLHYGIVISDKSIFDGKMNYSYTDECYLITNLDEKEKEIHEKLYTTYSKLQVEKQKKKLNKKSIRNHEKFGIYKNSHGYYLYLGKMRYNSEFLKDMTIEYWNGKPKISSFSNCSEGYAYLDLSYCSKSQIEDFLKDGKIDILPFLYYSYTNNEIHLNLSHFSGYHKIDLLKNWKTVDEYCGKVKVVEGIYKNKYIYVYQTLLEKNPNLDSYLQNKNIELVKKCWLEFID